MPVFEKKLNFIFFFMSLFSGIAPTTSIFWTIAGHRSQIAKKITELRITLRAIKPPINVLSVLKKLFPNYPQTREIPAKLWVCTNNHIPVRLTLSLSLHTSIRWVLFLRNTWQTLETNTLMYFLINDVFYILLGNRRKYFLPSTQNALWKQQQMRRLLWNNFQACDRSGGGREGNSSWRREGGVVCIQRPPDPLTSKCFQLCIFLAHFPPKLWIL